MYFQSTNLLRNTESVRVKSKSVAIRLHANHWSAPIFSLKKSRTTHPQRDTHYMWCVKYILFYFLDCVFQVVESTRQRWLVEAKNGFSQTSLSGESAGQWQCGAMRRGCCLKTEQSGATASHSRLSACVLFSLRCNASMSTYKDSFSVSSQIQCSFNCDTIQKKVD